MGTEQHKMTFDNNIYALLERCLKFSQLGVGLQTATVVVVCALRYSKVVLVITYPDNNYQRLHLYPVRMDLRDRHLRSL